MTFETLYKKAKATLNPRQLAKQAYAGTVASAILSESGQVYTGVCIDTPASMGFCAEHAAIAAMITAGENRILKLVSVFKDGSIIAPCGRCREFVNKIHDENHNCEVLLEDKVVTIKELLPYSWEK